MNAIQESKLNMYHTVELHCNNNNALIATNTAFSDAFGELVQNLQTIDAATTEQSQKITGYTTDKAVAKKALSKTASDVAAKIFAYASTEGNNTLKEKVNYTPSFLLRERDDQLIPLCTIILNSANDNLADLADYGITAKVIKDLQAAMDAFSATIPAHVAAKSSRKSYGNDLKQLFKDTDIILKERMDKLVANFAAADANFVSTYKNARNIIDPSFKKEKEG